MLLPGCFQLRDTPLWPSELQPVAVQATATERDFSVLLRQVLEQHQVALSQVEEAVTVVVGREVAARTVQSLDSRGKVDEYLLSYQIELSVQDHQGAVILPPQDYHDSRSFAYDARQALGLQRQQQEMLVAMRRQAVEMLIHRLAMLPASEGHHESLR